jgi:hypothetical protein
VRLVGELEGFFAGSSISQNVNGEMREGCRSLHRLIPLRFFWVEFLDDVDAMWVSAGSCALTHSPYHFWAARHGIHSFSMIQ